MPIAATTQFLRSAVERLSRLRPGIAVEPAVSVEPVRDSNWFLSSIDLAQGLDVIEHANVPPLFSDTLPAFHARPTRRG